MSRFNAQSPQGKTENLAGGKAYSQTPQLELISILLTSFANDTFYRDADGTFERLKELVKKCDKLFVAKACIYARTQFGMRSITHVMASELAKYIGGEVWARNFYNSIVYRVDDITEIIAYHFGKNGKLSNAMKYGLAKAFAKFNRYQLAKYKSENKSVKLIDAVNLLRPKEVEKNEGAISDLVNGKLKSFDTWENELSLAGQKGETKEQKDELKKEVWVKLIREKKIGYFALLRNLRNILEQSPDMISEVCELLVDEKQIKNSLVLPFRFMTAFGELKQIHSKECRAVITALTKAVDISLSNVPVFDGETCVVLDDSGSMAGRPAEIGSLFSAVLVKSNNADFATFANDCKYQFLNTNDSIVSISNSIRFSMGGTNFHSIFSTLNKKYDRIIILSDMQGWIGYDTPANSFNEYKKKFNCNPLVYSFDLNSYGTMQFPQQNIFAIAGFSEKIFDVMKLMESDKNALIKEIEKIEL